MEDRKEHHRRPARAALTTRFAVAAGVAAVWFAGCGSDPGGDTQPPAADVTASIDSTAVAGAWKTILERDMNGRRRVPEPFRASSDSLRVLTTLGLPLSEYSPGLVITNLLSDETAMPVASIRAEQRRIDVATTDTVVVVVPQGQLYFFVAEHRGLQDWRVTVQEFRAVLDP